MFLAKLSRQNQRQLSLALTFLTLRLLSFSSSSSSSNLYRLYSFKPPPSLSPSQSPNPNSLANPETTTKKKKKSEKPRYRSPSSLDRTGLKQLSSNLPFDFWYSYTESSPNVRPIKLWEPKYLPFGPGRHDHEWTGMCAPAVDRKVWSVEGAAADEVAEELKLEEERRKTRERVQGEPLTAAERKILLDFN